MSASDIKSAIDSTSEFVAPSKPTVQSETGSLVESISQSESVVPSETGSLPDSVSQDGSSVTPLMSKKGKTESKKTVQPLMSRVIRSAEEEALASDVLAAISKITASSSNTPENQVGTTGPANQVGMAVAVCFSHLKYFSLVCW